MAMPGEEANTPEIPVREGDVVASRYRIDRILGSGGMGVVVAATHTLLEQRVAIKLLHANATTNKELVRRFIREARVVAQMKNEHIARVFDVGELPNGTPFLAMELLEGMDLERYLEDSGPLPVGEAVSYILQACEALAEAHSLGIVHRDLKPANLFLTYSVDHRPLIKVLDFGLSKVTPGGSSPDWVGNHSSITRPLAIMGTPKYMSPEQLRSTRDVDERADIWSLGVILYELLSGRAPFESDSIADLCAAVVRDPPAPLENLPPGLEDVILSCLEKKADARFERVSMLATALVPYSEERLSFERILRVQPLSGVAPTPPRLLTPDRAFAVPKLDANAGDSADKQRAPSKPTTKPSALVPADPSQRRRRVIVGGVIAAVTAALIGVVIAIVVAEPQPPTAHAAETTARPSASPTPREILPDPPPSADLAAPGSATPAPTESAPRSTPSAKSLNPAAAPAVEKVKPPQVTSPPKASTTNPDRFLDTR